jgi:NAD(P)-dependent dehydrogenase (short-subunit alcohol dehydrogenase family)
MTGTPVLAGKTALVTGASGGIGSASAKLLARDGAALVLMGRRKEALEKARSAISAAIPGAHLEICAGDAMVEADVKAALAQTHKLNNRLDIVVSVVGGAGFKPLLLQDAQTFTNELAYNIVSLFLVVKFGVPMMEKGGTFVSISSNAGTLPFNGLSSYCTSKAGLEMFIRCAADELGPAGIRINAVRPGLTRSEATGPMYGNPAVLDRFVETMPLGRAGEAEDIGNAVRFLAGPESAWMTGQSFAVDGGQETYANPKLPDMLDAMFGADVMKAVRAGKPPQ